MGCSMQCKTQDETQGGMSWKLNSINGSVWFSNFVAGYNLQVSSNLLHYDLVASDLDHLVAMFSSKKKSCGKGLSTTGNPWQLAALPPLICTFSLFYRISHVNQSPLRLHYPSMNQTLMPYQVHRAAGCSTFPMVLGQRNKIGNTFTDHYNHKSWHCIEMELVTRQKITAVQNFNSYCG